jgi:hypothetical protein
MTHLTRHLVAADVRAAPLRTAAVALLLAAACLLPHAVSAGPGVGAVLGFAVAVAATVGATAAHERRAAVLRLNGAGPVAVEAALASASILIAGLAAAAVGAAVSALLDGGPSLATIVMLAVVVPVAAAPVAVWLVRRAAGEAGGDNLGAPTDRAGRRARRVARAVVVTGLALVFPGLAVAWLLLHLASPRRAHRALCRGAALVMSVVAVVGTALAAGTSSDWSSLWLVLVVLGPAAAGGVAVLGTAALDALGWVAARTGSWARLALGPLTVRSRALGPVVGALAVVTSLAALEATVGASFGQREADHERTIPTVTAPAGTAPDQAIARVGSVDPAELERIVDEVTAGTGTRAVVVERHGVGTTRTYRGPGLLPALHASPTTWLGSDPRADAPVWLGVVDPDEAVLLGVGASATDLAAGRAVVLNPAVEEPAGVVTVSRPGHTTDLPAVLAASAAASGGAGVPGVELPGALVSPETAATIDGPVSTARVVVVPEPGASVAPETLRSTAQAIVGRAQLLPFVAPVDPAYGGVSLDGIDMLERVGTAQVSLGDEDIVVFRSGPLNDVPLLAGTEDEGRGRLVGLGALALLMTVAGVGLALGASRADQAVLRVQGAPRALRSTVGAIQAAVLAGSSSLLAAAVGVALPALAFRVYGGHADLPAIPLVVPVEVVALLVGLPVVAAALTGVAGLTGHGTAERDPVPGDDLAW